jgi:hypothetical protein
VSKGRFSISSQVPLTTQPPFRFLAAIARAALNQEIHYARIRVRSKLIWKSPKTGRISVGLKTAHRQGRGCFRHLRQPEPSGARFLR